MYSNTTGDNNTALGRSALYSNTTGSNNVAIGYNALYKNTSSGNVAIGSGTLSNATTGSSNIAIGFGTLNANTTGSVNIAIGSSALYRETTGTQNIAIGTYACNNVTSGSHKTCIGYYSGPTGSSGATTNSEKVLYLGDSGTTVYIPGKLIVGQAFQANTNMYIGTEDSDIRMNLGSRGSSGAHKIGVSGDRDMLVLGSSVTISKPGSDITSDRRLKDVKGENFDGLAKIRQLKVFDYTFKKDKAKIPYVGVMAQDLEKIFPNSVTKGDDGYLKIRWDEMFYGVINAVKELDKIVQNLTSQVQEIFEQITGLDKRIEVLEKENKLLKEQINEMNKRLQKLEEDD